MPASNHNLDEKFGLCISPGKVSDLEKTFCPVSYLDFKNGGAAKLRNLVESVENSFYISHCLYSEFTMLWLVNSNGDLIIAIEEVVVDDEDSGRYPLPRLVPRENPIRLRKLGHPSLVKGGTARISGELNYDPETETWYLSNKSGRFGINVGRSPAQLEEVAEQFRAKGFTITAQFFGSRT